jgi:hypothetical protein
MTPIKPPQVTDPLSAEELERDAAEAGVAADEAPRQGGDTHLPASESAQIQGTDHKRQALEQRVAELPPG